MTPARISESVVSDKSEAVRRMLETMASLPLADLADFLRDPHYVAAGESYLRRALEALLDLGRHVLAKGFGVAVSEYKEIPRGLRERGVLSPDLAELLVEMAGYRNRLVHFYEAVSPEELYDILANRRPDLERVMSVLLEWIESRPSED